tara:strand:- start:988 stop:1140 length:153 start_codon:yes stop_codon:yes gene_type:complete
VKAVKMRMKILRGSVDQGISISGNEESGEQENGELEVRKLVDCGICQAEE